MAVTLVQTAQAFYNPSTGRWLSRDPIEEQDGPNLYAFIHNNPANRVDKDGRSGWQFYGPWDHDYFDPKCPGPDETDALILGMAATLLTPVPGDEAIVGALIIKRLEKVLNSCKPCKNIRCQWKILHGPNHPWPAPGDPKRYAYRSHIHILCWDRVAKKKLIDKRFPFGPYYKQSGGHGGETW